MGERHPSDARRYYRPSSPCAWKRFCSLGRLTQRALWRHHGVPPQPAEPGDAGTGFSSARVRDYAWAHSCSFEPQPAERVAASDPNHPFIVHAAEGIDEQSANELFLLDEMRALSDRTLLVHGLACS